MFFETSNMTGENSFWPRRLQENDFNSIFSEFLKKFKASIDIYSCIYTQIVVQHTKIYKKMWWNELVKLVTVNLNLISNHSEREDK